MSFLDNLEDNLKSLENSADGEDRGREQSRRKLETAAQVAVAPWAEQIRKSSYTEALLRVATREGFRRRTKVNISWLGPILRLDARERRLELRPQPDGIQAVFLAGNAETGSRRIDLRSEPSDLVSDWFG